MQSLDTLNLNLCPNSRIKSNPAFESQEEYEKFREEFAKAVTPDLERYRLARMRSEERARYHFVN